MGDYEPVLNLLGSMTELQEWIANGFFRNVWIMGWLNPWLDSEKVTNSELDK